MTPIEFPDKDLLCGKRGDLGLMIWSRLAPFSPPFYLIRLNSIDFGDAIPVENDSSFFELNDDAFQPDSIWLESEPFSKNQLNPEKSENAENTSLASESKRFSLTWSRSGAVLGRVIWGDQIYQDHQDHQNHQDQKVNANFCAISGPAFFSSSALQDTEGFSAALGVLPAEPGLSEEDMIERVKRSIDFARVFAATMPCVLSLDRASLDDIVLMSSHQASENKIEDTIEGASQTQAMDALAAIARLQARMVDSLNMSNVSGSNNFPFFTDYVKAAKKSRNIWLSGK